MAAPRLPLDFVAPPLASRVGRVLLWCGLVAAAVGGLQVGPALRERQQQHDELVRVATAVAPRVVPVKGAVPGLRSAQGMAAELTAPWASLLATIESVQTKDVALLAVEPIAARQSLQITADARNADAMLNLLAALREQPLTDVILVSHQLQAQQPGTPIRFQIQARWNNAGGEPIGPERTGGGR